VVLKAIFGIKRKIKIMNKINLKKAAMFGLDARIALAIFGALSVISGAALYSAIQEANVTKKVSQVKEIEKAIEQYILDTGSNLPFSTNAPASDFNIKALVEKPANVTGWNGPYLSYNTSSSSDYLVDTDDTNIAATFNDSKEFSSAGDELCKKTSAQCYVFISYLSANKYNKELDKKLDGTTTPNYNSGNFRTYIWGAQRFKTNIPFDANLSPNS
jgi:type II secretory pathway pseudopilin PulG